MVLIEFDKYKIGYKVFDPMFGYGRLVMIHKTLEELVIIFTDIKEFECYYAKKDDYPILSEIINIKNRSIKCEIPRLLSYMSKPILKYVNTEY